MQAPDVVMKYIIINACRLPRRQGPLMDSFSSASLQPSLHIFDVGQEHMVESEGVARKGLRTVIRSRPISLSVAQ